MKEGATGAGGGFGGSKVGVGSSWATMPVLGELPQELQRRLAGQRSKWGLGVTAMAESVIHSAVMGLLLMTSEVGRPVRERGQSWHPKGRGETCCSTLPNLPGRI